MTGEGVSNGVTTLAEYVRRTLESVSQGATAGARNQELSVDFDIGLAVQDGQVVVMQNSPSRVRFTVTGVYPAYSYEPPSDG